MSADWRILRNAETNAVILARARLCVSFWCHFRGLQLAPPLPDDEGLLFVTRSEGRSHTAIHMFFMRFSIGVVWLDAEGRVVDMQLAKPWRPAYAPQAPAQYYVEANPTILERLAVGDRLRFDEETT
ncbi:MAG: hypothetical protein GYB67_13505 [Chloroflexi bacterium]|nr:hypothetical protein [Chloroflexota bacterium]